MQGWLSLSRWRSGLGKALSVMVGQKSYIGGKARKTPGAESRRTPAEPYVEVNLTHKARHPSPDRRWSGSPRRRRSRGRSALLHGRRSNRLGERRVGARRLHAPNEHAVFATKLGDSGRSGDGAPALLTALPRGRAAGDPESDRPPLTFRLRDTLVLSQRLCSPSGAVGDTPCEDCFWARS